jgi:ATP-dependent Clp protease ATP-binding subunit ClpX
MIDQRMLNDKQCAICKAPPSESSEDELYYNFQGKNIFLCEAHADAFHTGTLMGQMELNSKIVEHIISLGDSCSIKHLKDQLYSMIPYSRRQVLERERFFSDLYESSKMSPREIYDYLDRNVIGQEDAKKRIALAVYEHYKNIQRAADSPLIDKQNILLLGPSGSGKTLIANTVAQMLSLPFAAGDATGFSPTGFKGDDADTVIQELYVKAKGFGFSAERGIVFIDEIDKLSTFNAKADKTESLNQATQSSLLKLIEGKKVKFAYEQQTHSLDTSRMLFIFGGAFTGISEQVAKLMGYSGRTMSLTRRAHEDQVEASIRSYDILMNAPTEVVAKALIDHGMSTELIGRLPIIVPLAPLTQEQLRQCLLTVPHAPTVRAQTLFAESGVLLEFEEDFISKVIEITSNSDTGTRSLRMLVKKAINQAAFDLLGKKDGGVKHVKITADCLSNPSAYVLA